MLDPVHHEAVIDFIRVENEIKFTRDLHDPFEDFARIHNARGVIRVDHDDRLRAGRHLFTHIVEIREPAALFVTDIVHRGTARERHGRGPERIVRRGDEHLISVIEKPLHGERDQFAYAISGEHIIHADIWDALFLAVVDDRAARAHETMGIGVALGVREIFRHCLEKRFRGLESEIGRVSDVQFHYIFTRPDHPVRFVHDRTADVIADVVELMGLFVSLHSPFSSLSKKSRAQRVRRGVSYPDTRARGIQNRGSSIPLVFYSGYINILS